MQGNARTSFWSANSKKYVHEPLRAIIMWPSHTYKYFAFESWNCWNAMFIIISCYSYIYAIYVQRTQCTIPFLDWMAYSFIYRLVRKGVAWKTVFAHLIPLHSWNVHNKSKTFSIQLLTRWHIWFYVWQQV